MNLRKRFFWLIIFAGFIGSATKVQAQTSEPFELQISPPVAYLQVEPGKAVTHTITVQQLGSSTLKVTPKLVDFAAGDNGQGLSLSQENTFPYLSTESRSLLGQSFLLSPGEKHSLTLTFSPPEGALTREYHLTLLLTGQTPTTPTLEAGADVSGTIGTNMIVLVSNDDRNRGQLHLKEIKLPKLVDSLSPLRFTILAENTGSNAAPASGSAQITDWQGKSVAHFDMYPDMVLAQNQRLLRPSQPATNSAQPTSEPVETPIFTYDPLFLLGPYTVEVTLPSNNSGQPMVYQVIALPFSLILVLLLIGGLYLGLDHFKTKLPLGRTLRTE